jgi:hypothetical protein
MTKFIPVAIVMAIAGGTAAAAFAQTRGAYGVVPVSYDNVEYYADDTAKSPSDKPPAPPAAPAAPAAPSAAAAAAAPAAAPAGSCGCNSCGCGQQEVPPCCKLDCPAQDTKRLFADNCWLKCHNITVQGFAEGGFAWHDGPRNPDGFNGPDGFNDRDGEFQLNQFYITIQKALKNNDTCWDYGFTVDLLNGTDYRYPLSRGLDGTDNGTPKIYYDDRKFYGLAIPQAYLEFGTSCLSYKVGHMYTLLGNEVVPAIGNVFYSHTYTFLYAYPFTHTGVLATYKANDQLTLVSGINEGWDTFNDEDENVSFTGQAIFTAKDKHTTLTFAFQEGDEPVASFAVGPYKSRYVQSLVLSHDLNDRLSYVAESAIGCQAGGDPKDGDTAAWWGLDGYFVYKLNCCWNAAVRGEWFRDGDGVRVAPVGDFMGGNTASAGGFAGDFNDITIGLQYHPNGNVQIRPELRYDWYNGARNGNGQLPYMAGNSDHQWIPAVDMIVQF